MLLLLGKGFLQTINGVLMSRIIVTDSTSCLGQLSYKEKIDIIPIDLHVDGKIYRDGIDITTADFISLVRESDILDLNTSPPSSPQLFNRFVGWRKAGVTEIIFILLSSKLSKLGRDIQDIAEYFSDEIKVHVFDSCGTGFPVGYLALKAEALNKQGKMTQTILRELSLIRADMKIMINVRDLSYLIRTKRVSAPVGHIGKLLGIKPTLIFTPDGTLIPYERKSSWEIAIQSMCENARDVADTFNHFDLAIMHPGDMYGEEFENVVTDCFPDSKKIVTLPSPAIVCHTGPDTYGIVVFPCP